MTAATAPAGTATCTGTTTPTQTAWLKAADGWDAKNGKMLASDGKLALVQRSDNAHVDVEGNAFMSFRFQGGIPTTAKVTEATLHVEHHEEDGFSSTALDWQVGGGSLTSPTTLGSTRATVLATTREATVEWDVSQWITDGARANDLKLVVRNTDSYGKKAKVDSVYLIVRYAP